jgi:hypothetical protein
MHKAWYKAVLLFALVLLVEGSLYAQNDVTFRVRMRVKILEGTFRPTRGDYVRVAGSFNDWGNSTDTLRDIGTVDSIYEKTKSLPTGQISYKFLARRNPSGPDTLDWEGDPNRTYNVIAGSQTLPAEWFDRDSIVSGPPTTGNVTFRVNMRVKMIEGTFRPTRGDYVRVAGSFNDWGNSRDTLRDATPTDSVYEKTITVNAGSIAYKFLSRRNPSGPDTLDWESGDNRTYTVVTGNQTLPVVWFDYDSLVSVPVSGNVTYRVDMRALQNIGWFVPPADSVQVRGGFNNWAGTAMTLSAITNLYQVTLPYNGFSFDQVDYKFFMKLDTNAAKIRFPGFANSGDRDGVQYDHPYTRGDGNRKLVLPQTGGNFNSDANYFSNIHRFGTMNNTTDTCRVTVKVNMGPATREPDAFIPATDTVYLNWQDQSWAFIQTANQGTTFARRLQLTRQGATDSVWTVTFKVKGKTHYGLLYNYEYRHVGGGGLAERSGLGIQNPFRSRYIRTTAPNTFPATYATPQDVWEPNAPHSAEIPQYGIVDVREDDGLRGIPEAYALHQNYPNPFNPSTHIKYSIPENAKVRLQVFNIIGQRVAELVNQEQTKGHYVALFEGNNLASGVYFYRLETKNFTETKKMLLMK